MTNNESIEQAPISEFEKVICIFIKPVKAMKEIVARPKLLIPFVVILLATILPLVIFYDDMLNTTFSALQEMYKAQGNIMPTSEVQRVADMAAKVSLITAPAIAAFTWVVFTAGIFVLVRLFGPKKEVGFAQILSITGYAYFIKVLMQIIVLIVQRTTGNASFGFNLYDFFTRGEKTLMDVYNYKNVLLSSFGIFRLWEYIVIAVGINTAAKFSKINGYIIMILVFIIFISFGLASAYINMRSGVMG